MFYTKPSLHSHHEFEIYYLHSGKVKFILGSSLFEVHPGDLVIMNGLSPHGTITQERCTKTNIRFDESCAAALIQPFGSFNVLKPFRKMHNMFWRITGERRENLESIFKNLNMYYSQPSIVNFHRLRLSFADLLLFIYELSEQHAGRRLTHEPDCSNRLPEVFSFLNQNYMHNLTLDHIAREVHYCKFYICKAIKKATGLTVFEYINKRRMNQAKLLFLLYPERTIADIGYEVGFKQPSHFSRIFKTTVGMPPEEYRRTALVQLMPNNDT